MPVYTVENKQGRIVKFDWGLDTEPTEDDIDEIFSGVIGKPTMYEPEIPPEPISGFQKVRNVLEAPGKGVLNFIASSPQWIGGLIKEHGERAEETPDFWDWALTPQMAVGKALKAYQAERTNTDEKIASFGDTMIKRNLEFIKDRPVLQPEEGKLNEFMFSLGSGAGSLAGAIGLSLLTKSPHVAAMAFGAMAKGHTYQRAREAGKSEREAGRLSTAHGFGEAALESLGLRLIFGKYAGRLIPSMITEGIQEMSQEIWGNVVARLGFDKAQKIMENVGMSGLIGFILGGGAGIVTGAVQNTESGQMLAESGADIGKIVTRMEETLLPQLQEIMESESGQVLISPEGEGVKPSTKETLKDYEILQRADEELLGKIESFADYAGGNALEESVPGIHNNPEFQKISKQIIEAERKLDYKKSLSLHKKAMGLIDDMLEKPPSEELIKLTSASVEEVRKYGIKGKPTPAKAVAEKVRPEISAILPQKEQYGIKDDLGNEWTVAKKGEQLKNTFTASTVVKGAPVQFKAYKDVGWQEQLAKSLPAHEKALAKEIGKPSAVTEDDAKSVIEKAGATWQGIQKISGLEDQAVFNEPTSKSTIYLPVSKVTPGAIEERLRVVSEKFITAPKPTLDISKEKGYKISEGEANYYALSDAQRENLRKQGRISGEIQNSAIKVKYKKQGYIKFPREEVKSPADVAFAFRELKNQTRESCYVIGLKNDVPVSVEPISMGLMSKALVTPYEPLHLLLSKKANGYYIVHNHPSGKVVISQDDKALTARFKEAYTQHHIEFKGHVVINDVEFGFLDPDGSFFVLPTVKFPELAKKVPKYHQYMEWLTAVKDRPNLGSVEKVVSFVKGLNTDWADNALAIYVDHSLRVNSMEFLPLKKLTAKDLSKGAVGARASGVILINSKLKPSEIAELNRDLDRWDIEFVDSIDFKGLDSFTSARERLKTMGFVREETEKYEAPSEPEVEKSLQEIQDEALKEIAKELSNDPSANLYLAIRSLGGVRFYKTGVEQEEMAGTPAFLFKREGQAPDELRQSLEQHGWHFDNTSQMFDAIRNIAREKGILIVSGKAQVPYRRIAIRSHLRALRVAKNPKLKAILADIKRLGKKLEKPLAKGKVKPIIHEQVGITKVEIPVETTQMNLVKARLLAERRGAKAGERIGRVETRKKIYKQLKSKEVKLENMRKGIIDYAKEYLTPTDSNRIFSMAARVETSNQAVRVLNMIEKMEERYQRHIAVDDIKKTVKGIDFKRLRPEYKGAIQKITDSIDLVKRRDKTIDGLNSMLSYIVRNPDHNIPDKQIQRLAILSRTKIENLTTEDINLINDSVKHLVKLNDLKGKIIIGRKIKDFKEVRAESIENVNKKDPVEVDPREGIRVTKAKTFFTTEATNAEHICKQIDKEEHGEIKQVLFDGIDSGVSELLRIQHEADDYFKGKIGHIDVTKFSETFHPERDWKKNVTYENFKLDSGKTIKLTPAERISLSLLELNQNSLRHILDGGIRLANNPDILYKLTAEDLAKLTSLNPAEADIANGIYHYFNTIQKGNLNKVSLRLNGWEVATEDDYFPIRVYGIDVRRPYLLREEALPSNMRAFTQSTLEGMGMLKERIASSTPLILEDAFATTYKSMKQASTYCGLAESLRSAKALLLDPEFRTAINTRYGKHYWVALNNYVRDIEGEYQQTDNVDKMITGWINRLDIAILGLNPFVMLKQPISFMNAAVEMDSKYLLQALAHKPETTETMGKHSSQLRDRFAGNVTRELGEVGQVGQVRKFWTGKGTLGQGLMKGIKNFDYQAIGRIWKAVEYETNALHPALEGDAKMQHIAERTEEIVRLTQPTFHLKDRSSIGRSRNVWLRLMTKYTSQRNKNYMTILRSVQRYNASNKSGQDKAKLMKSIAIVTLMNALMLYGVDELRNWLYKREKPERRERYAIFKGLEYMLGNVYLVGNAFRSLTSKIERGTYAGFDMSDILMSWGESGVNAMANTFRAIDQVISQEKYKAGDKKGELKWKYSAQKGIDEALSFTLRLKGLPYDTVKKLLLIPFSKQEKKRDKGSILFEKIG